MARRTKANVVYVDANYTNLLFLIIILGGFFLYYQMSKNNKEEVKEIVRVKDIGAERTSFFNSFFPMGFTNISSDVLTDPYVAPLRDPRIFPRNSSDIRGIPINIRTQGFNTSYRQVGILTRNGGQETILPLMGRPLMANRDKWQFYTINDKFNGIKLPVVSKGKSCTNEYGCDDLMNGEDVYIEGYKDTFKVTIYDTNLPEYIPYV